MTVTASKKVKKQYTPDVIVTGIKEGDELHLFTVRQFCLKYTWPSESALRALILNSEINGFQSAFVRVGRRVLVNVPSFFQIIKKINQRGSNE